MYDLWPIIYTKFIFHVKIYNFLLRQSLIRICIRIRIGLAHWIRIRIRTDVKSWIHNTAKIILNRRYIVKIFVKCYICLDMDPDWFKSLHPNLHFSATQSQDPDSDPHRRNTSLHNCTTGREATVQLPGQVVD